MSDGGHGGGIHESLQLILNNEHPTSVHGQAEHADHDHQAHAEQYQAEASLPAFSYDGNPALPSLVAEGRCGHGA